MQGKGSVPTRFQSSAWLHVANRRGAHEPEPSGRRGRSSGYQPPEPGWHHASSGNTAHAQPAWKPSSVERAFSTPPASVDENDKAGSPATDPRWQPQPPVVDPGLLSRQSSRSSAPAGDASVVVKVVTRCGPLRRPGWDPSQLTWTSHWPGPSGTPPTVKPSEVTQQCCLPGRFCSRPRRASSKARARHFHRRARSGGSLHLSKPIPSVIPAEATEQSVPPTLMLM